MKTLRTVMAEHPFLRGMDPAQLEILAKDATEVEFHPGEVIFREGEAAYQFYLIQEGKVAVESHLLRDGDIPVQVLDCGDVLGWSWLFSPFAWHFQARALEPTKAIFVDGARLLVACEENHDLGYELMKRVAQVLIQRLQATRKSLAEAPQGRETAPVTHEAPIPSVI